jgi:hypothetical protein
MQLQRPRHFRLQLPLAQLHDLATLLMYLSFLASLWQLRRTLLPISPEYQLPRRGDTAKRSTVRWDLLSRHTLM